MKLLHTNLTPFFWGPKVTSRRGRQLEMTVCVRGVFRLRPGQPLEAIEDKMEQGFMSGDTWAESDPERTGPITHTSDFADWKPFAEVFLRGTAHPPKGSDVACEVKFAVGEWSKTLRVTGPRTFKPGVLFGGAASDPQPFTSMPLTWENAYGGPGYPQNPIGKGFAGPELPTVEDPKSLVGKSGAKGVLPGTFLPVSPLWSPRAQKMVSGSYGKKWQETRAPYPADEFDWTFHNAAPADQQLPKYLKGDEPLLFENLHPEARRWEAKLPGLRIRALVEYHQETAVRDIALPLDTVFADTDAGRLYLVWRGHVPVSRLDMADVKGVLIASEPLAEAPRPHEEYLAELRAYLDDPVGLKSAFPPGFMMFAEAVEAWDKAELTGGPKPDLKAVAKNLPPGCPFPPWFLAAIEGDKDPLGIRAKLAGLKDPKQLAASMDPMAAAVMSIDLKKLDAAFKAHPRTADGAARALEQAAKDMPEEIGKQMREAAAKLKAELAKARAAVAHDPKAAAALEKALTTPQPPAQSPTAAQQMAGIVPMLEAKTAEAAKVSPEAAAAMKPALEKARAIPSFDAMVAQCLAPLDQVVLPKPPPIPDVEKLVAAHAAELKAEEEKLRSRGVNHPLLGLFALGHRLLQKAPRPADVAPDLTPISAGLGQAAAALKEQGASDQALGPLTRLRQRVDALLAKLPQPRPGPVKKDLAYEELDGADLTGRDLRGKSLARAKLEKARFGGAQLAKADLTEAVLVEADLQGVDLQGAVLVKARLTGARLAKADLRGADLSGADLSEADLSGANLAGANLEGAVLQDAKAPGADLSRANLTSAQLPGADLSRAKLVEAGLEHVAGEKVRFEGADLSKARLNFAALAKSDLRGASLREADLSIAQLTKCKGDGADLSGAKLDMAQFNGSRLVKAKLEKVRGGMPSFTGCDLTGASLREAELEKADFGQAVLEGTDLGKATLRACMMRDAQAKQASFVETDLGGTSFTGKAVLRECRFHLAKARRAVFMEVDLSGSDFSHADLSGASFQGVTGSNVSFFAALLRDSTFRDADLSRSKFVRADLCAAEMVGAKLVDVQLTGANLYETKLIEAQLAGCDFLEANLARARFERAVGAPT